jgi:hypothetical protein
MSELKTIGCCDHGQAHETYVCKHLIEGTNTDWYSGEVDDEHEWPDSWCGNCNKFYEAEGEWNEESEQAAELSTNIKLLCHHCYQHIRSRCTTHSI